MKQLGNIPIPLILAYFSILGLPVAFYPKMIFHPVGPARMAPDSFHLKNYKRVWKAVPAQKRFFAYFRTMTLRVWLPEGVWMMMK